MKIKVTQNFAHAPSKQAFQIGKTYDVKDESAKEFAAGGLCEIVEEPKAEPKKSAKE